MVGGSRQITKVLVANRGEIARRVFATCERMGIATVAVHSDPDAEAPFVADAAEAVALGGESAAESYLDAERVLEAARRSGADAIHPGYGFLAENAGFARAVLDAGLVWIGPPPEAIEAMGSKLRARELMAEAGVPVVPGAELGEGAEPGAEAERIGYPLIVKASAGGGGKGMRVVSSADALGDAIAAARREAKAAFGDETVFLERYLERHRHVEIQVLADAHGNTASLGERECSIQRRHQKVIEESPSPAVDDALRGRMGAAATAAAEAVAYRGAGTVEMLLGPEGEFYFLEMNTRLQVEHPVTELVTGLDLVRLQLLVAAGAELPPEALEPRREGAAIEARLYAEDAAAGFLPQTGRVERISFPGASPLAAPEGGRRAGLRLDAGVEDGSLVSPHYDPMLAKVIAWAPTREEAARRLAAALAGSELHGPVTNRDFLARVLRHEAFLAGETDTGFLERHAGLTEPLVDADSERLHAAAAALATVAEHRAQAPVLGFTRPGFRNNPSESQRVVFSGEHSDELTVAYGLNPAERDAPRRARPQPLEIRVEEDPLAAPRLHALDPGRVDLEVAGLRRSYRVRRSDDGETIWVNSALGQSRLVEQPRYGSAEAAGAGGALVAPMPGKVIRLAVTEGEEVDADAVSAVLEAMKMEHELTAPAAGTVAELHVAEGDQLDPGAAIATIEAAE